MSGTYKITEVISQTTGKFTCKVAFNGGDSELYEVSPPRLQNPLLDEDGGQIFERDKPLFGIYDGEITPEHIAEVLQKVADEAADSLKESVLDIKVDESGQIIL